MACGPPAEERKVVPSALFSPRVRGKKNVSHAANRASSSACRGKGKCFPPLRENVVDIVVWSWYI